MAGKYHTYAQLTDSVHYNRAETDKDELEELLRFMKYLPATLRLFHQTFFILDYRSRQYKLLSKSNGLEDRLGYKMNSILEGGLDFLLDVIKKEDILLINEKIFTEVLTFLKTEAQSDTLDYLFTYTFRVRSASGKFPVVMQKCKYLIDKNTGLPLFTFGTVMDVSYLKSDASMIFMIDRYASTDAVPVNVLTRTYYPDIEDGLLSQREREVLLWIAEGLSSKMIAGKMGLSKYTVDNHRKSLFKKTNAANVAELVRYAINNRLI